MSAQFSQGSRERRAQMTTCPLARRAATMCRPRKPDAPVTSTCFNGFSCHRKGHHDELEAGVLARCVERFLGVDTLGRRARNLRQAGTQFGGGTPEWSEPMVVGGIRRLAPARECA
jgi:hypothetical protein